MSDDRLAIAQVTPYAWEAENEVNGYVRRVAAELESRGHRVLVVAPSSSQAAVRETRKLVREARDRPEVLLEPPDGGETGGVRVLAVGEVLPLASSRRRSLPIDVARTVEEVLTVAPLDVVHVHEPFAPSVAGAALRHSRALNVGTFHAAAERALSTQVARKVVELVFGRLDARLASYSVTCDLMKRFFPAEYQVILPGADVLGRAGSNADAGPPTIAFLAEEERPALRAFLRALRRIDSGLDWRAVVWSADGQSTSTSLRRDIRERVRFTGPHEVDEASVLREADLVVAASAGVNPAPGLLLRAIGASAVPVAARLPAYEEVLAEGERGLLFEPRDVYTLAAQLSRLLGDPSLRARLGGAADPLRERLPWSRVADELEAVYGGLVARRHDDRGDATVGKRLAGRKLIDVDLHMHTDHSHDCATTVDELLAAAKERGLGAIAVTDHNEISGALEAAERADGIKVIVAEEVKTADQGEVIGLFITEKIERGMTLEETIAEIKRQGGIVYVPHPFDRMHAVPDYEHLLSVIDDVDAIEVYNPRVAVGSFNEEAVRFAAKYRIPAGAGSDAHVVQGLGSARIRMRDFDGPEEFLESLRDADIVRKPANLLYVQALKFLQTKSPLRRKS
jgi:glycosyltransferase involved in cell wall biosynthesis